MKEMRPLQEQMLGGTLWGPSNVASEERGQDPSSLTAELMVGVPEPDPQDKEVRDIPPPPPHVPPSSD